MSERRSVATHHTPSDIESSSKSIEQQIHNNITSRIQIDVRNILGNINKSSNPIEIEHRSRDHQVGIRRRDKKDVSGKRGFRVMVSLNKFFMWFIIIFIMLPLLWFVYILSKHFKNSISGSSTVIDNSVKVIPSIVIVQDEIIAPPEFIEIEEEPAPVIMTPVAANVIPTTTEEKYVVVDTAQVVDANQAEVEVSQEEVNSDTSSSTDVTDKSVEVVEQQIPLDTTMNINTEIEIEKSFTTSTKNNEQENTDTTPAPNTVVNTSSKEETIISPKDTTTTITTTVKSAASADTTATAEIID